MLKQGRILGNRDFQFYDCRVDSYKLTENNDSVPNLFEMIWNGLIILHRLLVSDVFALWPF